MTSKATESDILDRYMPYTFKQILKHSGNGFVYIIRPNNASEQLVLKIIPLDNIHDPGFVDKKTNAEEEYSNMQLLISHTTFVHPIDSRYYEKDSHGYYDILMEHCGKALSDLKFDPNVSLMTKIDWMKQCIEGMAYAESRNIYHGDLKPNNMLMKNGNVLKLIDLGGSRSLGTVTYSKTVARVTEKVKELTPCYAAPELLEGRTPIIMNKLDIYAFGKTFYEIFYNLSMKDMEQERMKLCVIDSTTKFLKIDEDSYTEWNKGLLKREILKDESNNEHLEVINKVLSLCLEYDPHKRPTFSELQSFVNSSFSLIEANRIDINEAKEAADRKADEEDDLTVKYAGRPKPEDVVGKDKFINPYNDYKELLFYHTALNRVIRVNLDCENGYENSKSFGTAKFNKLLLPYMSQSLMVESDKLIFVGGKLRVGYCRSIHQVIIKRKVEENKAQKPQSKTQPKGIQGVTFVFEPKELKACLLFSRAYFGLVLAKGRTYVLGGITDDEIVLKSCEVISLRDETVSKMPPLSEAKESLSACAYQDRWIFVFGGRYQDFVTRKNMLSNYSNVIEQYDVECEYWKTTTLKEDSLYQSSVYAGAIQISVGEILLFGGIMKIGEPVIEERKESIDNIEQATEERRENTNITASFGSVGYNVKERVFDRSDFEVAKPIVFTGLIASTYFIKDKVYAFSAPEPDETYYRVFIYDTKLKTWRQKSISFRQ